MRRYYLQFGVRSIALPTGTLAIGRSDQSDLRIDDPRVSRTHAVIHHDVAGVRISDRRSQNGVFVNGKRIVGTMVLDVGDRIAIGSEEFSLCPVVDNSEHTSKGARGSGEPKTLSETLVETLSVRERQVFELLVRGHTQKTIAERLKVSTKTVETYRTRIRDKLCASNRSDLLEIALQAGVLSRIGSDTQT